MKRALLYITFLSFALTPTIFAVGVTHVHAGPADAIDLKVTAPSSELSCLTFNSVGIPNGINWGMCAANVTYLILSLVAWIFGGVGVLLNYVVQELVFRMGAMTGMLEGVTIAWTVMRDIANVFLVFLVLFIGVATIVRATSYNSKRLLFQVILAALLVNFSLYFAKVVIDVTNLFAAQTYIMILKEGLTDPITGKAAMGDIDPATCAKSNQITPLSYDSKCFTIGISGAIINMLRIQSIYKDASQSQATGQQASDIAWNLFYTNILGTILLLILIFIFLAVIVLFITRFITLVYLMIISPVAFVSLVTGKFGFGATWWNQLLNNALFAPVYFLLLWVAVLVISRMMLVYMPVAGPGQQVYSALALGNTSGFTLLIVFTVAAGLLIGALIAAKKLGVAGTNMATSFAGGVMFGGAAWAWRNTGGRYSNRRANDKELQDAAAGRRWDPNAVWKDANGNERKGRYVDVGRGTQLRAQMKLKTYQKAAASSGDIRNSTRLGKIAKAVPYAKEIDLGKGTGTGGYTAMRKKYEEGHVKFAESLGVDTERQTALRNELDGEFVIVKDADGNPVIDPATGQPKRERRKGVKERIEDTKKEVTRTQEEIDTHKEELSRARKEGDTDAIAYHERGLALKQQELSAHQAESRTLRERKRQIEEEELPMTHRGLAYATNLEKAATSNIKVLGWDTGLKAPGYMAPGGIVFGTNYEQQSAANAIRKKFKNQTKYKSTIDALKEMKSQGVISGETANKSINELENASEGQDGGSRGQNTSDNGDTGGTTGPTPSAQPFRRPPSSDPQPSTPSSTAAPVDTPRPFREFTAGEAIPTPAQTDPRFNSNETDPAKIREAYGRYMREPENPQAVTTPTSAAPSQPSRSGLRRIFSGRRAQQNPAADDGVGSWQEARAGADMPSATASAPETGTTQEPAQPANEQGGGSETRREWQKRVKQIEAEERAEEERQRPIREAKRAKAEEEAKKVAEAYRQKQTEETKRQREAMAYERQRAKIAQSWANDPMVKEAEARQKAENKQREENQKIAAEKAAAAAEQRKQEYIKEVGLTPRQYNLLKTKGPGSNFGLPEFQGEHIHNMGKEAFYNSVRFLARELQDIDNMENARDAVGESPEARVYWNKKINAAKKSVYSSAIRWH